MAIRITRLTRIVGLTGAVLALSAGAAPARPVALWGCHGPLGQPLGAAGLVATQAGDGTTFAAAGACESATGPGRLVLAGRPGRGLGRELAR